jgi:site-specific recombinase XerC
MTKYLDSGLFKMIHDFLKLYLPKQRKVSPHTVRAYKNAIDLLLDYVREQKNVPLEDVTFQMLTSEMMLSFLDSVEDERAALCPREIADLPRCGLFSLSVQNAM